MATSAVDRRAEQVRRFNRFYTRRVGALGRRFLGSDLSLTEVRVLYELAHRAAPTAAELSRDLELDPGYLSRMIRGFADRGLVVQRRSGSDGRRSLLALTAAGRKLFAPLDARAHEEVRSMLAAHPVSAQRRLIRSMRTIEDVLSEHRDVPPPCVLREPRAGDFGWVVHRHGALYRAEYGWDEHFEALVAGVVASFVERFDPARERCWIAERNDEMVGSVFVVAKSKTVAKLRLLLVEPEARGLGIGGRLVDGCVTFARGAGYRSMELWTQSALTAARRIYERAGFRLIREEPHRSFGADLVGETWRIVL